MINEYMAMDPKNKGIQRLITFNLLRKAQEANVSFNDAFENTKLDDPEPEEPSEPDEPEKPDKPGDIDKPSDGGNLEDSNTPVDIETVEETTASVPEKTVKSKGGVETGDEGTIALYALLMLLTGSGAVALAAGRRKDR